MTPRTADADAVAVAVAVAAACMAIKLVTKCGVREAVEAADRQDPYSKRKEGSMRRSQLLQWSMSLDDTSRPG